MALETGKAGVKKRAKFKLAEVTQTNRGVAVLTAKIVHDPAIQAVDSLATGSIPVGSITLETSPEYASSLALNDTYFYITQA